MLVPGRRRSRLQLELGVTESTHLGKIQTLEFRLRTYPLPNDQIDDPVEYKAQREDKADQRGNANELGHKLRSVAVEQAGDASVHTVPRASIVALPVGK